MKPSSSEIITPSKREYWQSHIKSWEESKLKQEAYCVNAGIRYSTFVYWRGILLNENMIKKKDKFVPVKIKKSNLSMPESSPRAIQVKLVSGNVVYIPTTLSMTEIGALIRSLENGHA